MRFGSVRQPRIEQIERCILERDQFARQEWFTGFKITVGIQIMVR